MVQVVRALYKYNAQRPDELSFEEGDLLFVYGEDVEPNWLRAKCRDREGLVPVNYIKQLMGEVKLPLHDAARRGNISLLKECLKQGVSGTGLDAAGNTPLYWAARSGHIDCVKELLNIPNPAINAQNKMGDTPLHVAASHGHCHLINLLLENGADLTLRNNDGLLAEQLASNVAVKNAIQLSQRHYNRSCGYVDDDYKDESD